MSETNTPLRQPNDGQAKPNPKTMTKTERRELQEKQKAAKAAAGGKSAGAQARAAASSALAGANNSPQQSRKAGRRSSLDHKLVGNATTSPLGSAPPGKQFSRDLLETVSSHYDNESRDLRIFAHFANPRRTATLIYTGKGEIHASIVRLGLQFAEFKITGANARCIATLEAFKNVIQDYSTPSHETLSRHLLAHLSHQISYLVSSRPMSVTMGNAIRQLKLEISQLSFDLPEQDAKDHLCKQLDTYIQHRIILADEVIEGIAAQKIHDGDVILTYARSSVVEKVLISAFTSGENKRRFSVIVIDSRPLLEGKKLLTELTRAGIPCTYALLPALPSLITEVSTVFIGAHALHANGAVYSRAGTALVAMMAREYSVPVLVCCETYKSSGAVHLDSFTKNELAPPADRSAFPKTVARDSLLLQNSPELIHLQTLSPLYDLTPPTNITAVVTEVGIIPPSSIGSIPDVMKRENL